MLIDPEEEDGVGLFVVDHKEERVVRLELGVEQRAGGTEAEQELAAVFGIRSIPSILFVPMDDKPQMAMGALPKNTFQEVIRDKFGVAVPN